MAVRNVFKGIYGAGPAMLIAVAVAVAMIGTFFVNRDDRASCCAVVLFLRYDQPEKTRPMR
jgi:hypothetical protein